jgi:hypothetical protein
MDTLKQIYGQYAWLLKAIAGIVIGLAVGYGLYRLFLYVRNKIAELNDPSQNLGINQSNLSYSDAEFKLMADSLEVAMAGPGTDEPAIVSVFNQLQTPDDLKALVKAFGIRAKGSVFPDQWNLTQWLTDEFSQTDLEPIKQIFINSGVPF